IGGIGYIFLVAVLGSIVSYGSSVVVGEPFTWEVTNHIWLVMSLQASVGLFLGGMIGLLFFDRSVAFQVSFALLALNYVLTIFTNVAFKLDQIIKDILNYINIIGYLRGVDILFLRDYSVSVTFPLIYMSIFLALVSGYIISTRDFNETEHRSVFSYFRPSVMSRSGFSLNGNDGIAVTQHNGSFGQTPEFPASLKREKYGMSLPASRLLVAWSRPLEKRFPFLVDELWSGGTFLSIYAILVFAVVFVQMMVYTDVAGRTLVDFLVLTPIYYMFNPAGIDLSGNLYLAFLTTQYHGIFWMLYLPFIVYRFYKLETRDLGGRLSAELIWGKPARQRRIYLERLSA
ncbi:MAG TPA: hypothetical protein VJ044_01780, partial [Candidatus Hodarchaeales archaeon]|nr:hypothetical protein [Candidatus Hodarchaeales archaeon]